jgi:hypothetical protein
MCWVRSLSLGIFIALACMVAAGPSVAATLVGTTDDASGINGLVIDGVTYNATFVNGSYNSVYASTPPTFLCNPGCAGANDAVAVLLSALNSLNVIDLVGLSPSSGGIGAPTYGALIPEVVGSGIVDSIYAGCGTYPNGNCVAGTWSNDAGIFTEVGSTYPYDDYVVFTAVTATPLPATVPLFITGLAGLGLLGRRKKRKDSAAVAA